jgi:hypothetical protein
MSQLTLNGIDHERSLPSIEAAQMLQCYWCIDDLVRQAQVSFLAVWRRSHPLCDALPTRINPHATPAAGARGGG